MGDDLPESELVQGFELVCEVQRHLDAARADHEALAALVGKFPAVTVDELAVGLNISRAYANLLAGGASFEKFLATCVATPDISNRAEQACGQVDWVIAFRA